MYLLKAVCDIFMTFVSYDRLSMCVTLAALFAYDRLTNISSDFLPSSLLVKCPSPSKSETHVCIF